jgi:hypothetical protein
MSKTKITIQRPGDEKPIEFETDNVVMVAIANEDGQANMELFHDCDRHPLSLVYAARLIGVGLKGFEAQALQLIGALLVRAVDNALQMIEKQNAEAAAKAASDPAN